jgi:hypothetical protein
MGAVVLPSRETRYYDRFGNEITGYGSALEAARFAGDPTAGLETQAGAWPKEWTGRGTLPGGARPTGRKIRIPGKGEAAPPPRTQEETPAGIPFRVVNAQRGGTNIATIAAPPAATGPPIELGGSSSLLNALLAALGRLAVGEPV